MKLWLIQQSENCGYDTYDSAVVAANTEEKAQHTHPNSELVWSEERRRWEDQFARQYPDRWYDPCDWAERPKDVQVTLIGTAKRGTKAGVVIASFNAG